MAYTLIMMEKMIEVLRDGGPSRGLSTELIYWHLLWRGEIANPSVPVVVIDTDAEIDNPNDLDNRLYAFNRAIKAASYKHLLYEDKRYLIKEIISTDDNGFVVSTSSIPFPISAKLEPESMTKKQLDKFTQNIGRGW